MDYSLPKKFRRSEGRAGEKERARHPLALSSVYVRTSEQKGLVAPTPRAIKGAELSLFSSFILLLKF